MSSSKSQYHTSTLLAADMTEAMSFVFFNSPLEAFTSFVFCGCLRVSLVPLRGRPLLEEGLTQSAAVYPMWPAVERLTIGPLSPQPRPVGSAVLDLFERHA